MSNEKPKSLFAKIRSIHISNKYYYDEATAQNTLNSLSPEKRFKSRLVSAWGDETVFYANPYLGP